MKFVYNEPTFFEIEIYNLLAYTVYNKLLKIFSVLNCTRTTFSVKQNIIGECRILNQYYTKRGKKHSKKYQRINQV